MQTDQPDLSSSCSTAVQQSDGCAITALVVVSNQTQTSGGELSLLDSAQQQEEEQDQEQVRRCNSS